MRTSPGTVFLHLRQYTFSADNLSEAGKIYCGTARLSGRGRPDHRADAGEHELPHGHRGGTPEEFAPGLDPELLQLVQATAEIELDLPDQPQVSQS
jgi:Mn-containing catalase